MKLFRLASCIVVMLLLSVSASLVFAQPTGAGGPGAADRAEPDKEAALKARQEAILKARMDAARRKAANLDRKAEAAGADPHAGHDHAAGEHGDAETPDHSHAGYKGALQTAGEDGGENHGNSKFAALLFWLFAFAAVGGAVFVITRRNMIVAVMGMVGTFFAIAGLYAMLYAHFLAVIQILVYAGAIMVLFVFVIMILNAETEQRWAIKGLFGKGIAGVALLYFLGRLGKVLWHVKDGAAATMQSPVLDGSTEDFGSVRAIGDVLFTNHLFSFEAVSVVLLVAVVGAVAIARPSVTAGAKKEAAS